MKKTIFAIAGAFALFAAAGAAFVANQHVKDEMPSLLQANIEALGRGEPYNEGGNGPTNICETYGCYGNNQTCLFIHMTGGYSIECLKD